MKRILNAAACALLVVGSVIFLSSGITKEHGGYKNLVDELYYQAVKQNSSLEAIDEDMERFYKKKDDALEKYNSFTAYNNRYYNDARAEAAAIQDAAQRQAAHDLINASEARYKTKLVGWQSDIATLNSNEKELKNLYARLKIITTLPVIEKFQTGLPDGNRLKEANSDLVKLIEKIKTLTR
jgi:hypothetical protein